jgi:hypothetical protein
MAESAYTFYRYVFLDAEDEELAADEQRVLIDGVVGTEVPHRKSDPTPNEFDTFIMRPSFDPVHGEPVVAFDVAHTKKLRVEHRYDPDRDDIEMTEVRADDTVWTHAILIPRLGIAALRDGSGDKLSSDSGVSRIKSIVRFCRGGDFVYTKTASTADVRRAAKILGLTEFRFQVRPFNPHPKVLGEKLHELMKVNDVQQLNATAKPSFDHTMNANDGGVLAEAIGLADEGYGAYGFKGVTENGVRVTYAKQPFKESREEALRQQSRPAKMKIIVPDDDEEMTEDEYIVKTVLDLYDDDAA